MHPTDRVVTIYLLENGAYGKPAVYELQGTTAAVTLPKVVIDWARVLRE
ncbi:hypothetical protein JCM16106_14590 [Hydrogenophilus islandicus]